MATIKEDAAPRKRKAKNVSPEVIEYEDMTDAQKRIVDAAEGPSAGMVPPGLSHDELKAWVGKMMGLKNAES